MHKTHIQTNGRTEAVFQFHPEVQKLKSTNVISMSTRKENWLRNKYTLQEPYEVHLANTRSPLKCLESMYMYINTSSISCALRDAILQTLVVMVTRVPVTFLWSATSQPILPFADINKAFPTTNNHICSDSSSPLYSDAHLELERLPRRHVQTYPGC